MDYIQLGKSDLQVSQLGFGCCPMGKYGWGEVSSEELIKAAWTALDNGVNFFDTADIYGKGESEAILGKALKGRRNEAIIATKFGVRIDNKNRTFYDNSPEWIASALDNSLTRLGVDYIDLYQIHYLDKNTPFPLVVETLEKKRKEGKIRFYGLSNISLKDIDDINLPQAMLSFQNEYSLANRLHEDAIKQVVLEKKLGFISWGSLGQGVLSGKYDHDTKFTENDRRSREIYKNFHGDKLKKNLIIVSEMKKISDRLGKGLPQIAIRWILDYLKFSIVLVGVKNSKQLYDNIGAFGWHLEQEEISLLEIVSN